MTDDRFPLGGSHGRSPAIGTESAHSGHTPATDSPLPSGGFPGWVGARDGRSAAARSGGYVELHAHSAYSFLDGASLPEELAARASELGYDALALTDHD